MYTIKKGEFTSDKRASKGACVPQDNVLLFDSDKRGRGKGRPDRLNASESNASAKRIDFKQGDIQPLNGG